MSTLKRREIEAMEPKEEPPIDVLGWISVDERLPDLVNSKDARYVTKERYSDPVLVFDGSEVHVGTYGDVEGWLSGYETLDSVTHWMPLPAPPTDAK